MYLQAEDCKIKPITQQMAVTLTSMIRFHIF